MASSNLGNEEYDCRAADACAAGPRGYARRLPSVLLALAAALALLVLGDGGVGQAQTGEVLVGNFGQTRSNTAPASQYDFAQAFTTGSNSHGYTLRSIDFKHGGRNNSHQYSQDHAAQREHERNQGCNLRVAIGRSLCVGVCQLLANRDRQVGVLNRILDGARRRLAQRLGGSNQVER